MLGGWIAPFIYGTILVMKGHLVANIMLAPPWMQEHASSDMTIRSSLNLLCLLLSTILCRISNRCSSVSCQGGEVHRPGHQACQRGGLIQMGGKDPPWRGEGHGCHRPHAFQAGLRPARQPPQLRPARPQGSGQHSEGECSAAPWILTLVQL